MAEENIELDAVNWYINNRDVYKRLAIKVESIINEIFDINGISFHMITSRAKEIESFKNKISNDKYDDPINQVHDFAGLRIITYVEDEIDKICTLIEQTFDIDAPNSFNKGQDLGIDKVGYKSIHYVAKLKSDRLKLPEYKQFENKFFEIQVRTILQHAWAEIEHDRNYKFSGKLPDEISRRFKLLAGSLELADREFNNISKEIDEITEGVKEETKKGNLNIDINSTSLSQFFRTRFEKISNRYELFPQNSAKLIQEMEMFGLHKLEDLNKIIPKNFEEIFLQEPRMSNKVTEIGLGRMIMIINNKNRYFKNAFNDGFKMWSRDGHGEKTFNHYGVNWDDIFKDYGVPLIGQ